MAWWGVSVADVETQIKMLTETSDWVAADIEDSLNRALTWCKAQLYSNFSAYYTTWDASGAPDAAQYLLLEVAVLLLIDKIQTRNNLTFLDAKEIKAKKEEINNYVKGLLTGHIGLNSVSDSLNTIASVEW